MPETQIQGSLKLGLYVGKTLPWNIVNRRPCVDVGSGFVAIRFAISGQHRWFFVPKEDVIIYDVTPHFVELSEIPERIEQIGKFT